MNPRRLVLTFTREGLQVRALYRSKGGPNPGTKARRREATEMVRAGLRAALAALDGGDADVIGTAGFETREDTLSVDRRTA